MYEIWLAVNIAWEIVVAQAVWAVPLAIVFAGLVVHALARRGDWVLLALIAAAVAVVVGAIAWPLATVLLAGRASRADAPARAAG